MKKTQLSQNDRIQAALEKSSTSKVEEPSTSSIGKRPRIISATDSRRLAVFYTREIEKHTAEIKRHETAIRKLTDLRTEELMSQKKS